MFPARTSKGSLLDEDIGALRVHLSDEDLQRIDLAFPLDIAAGSGYPETMMASVNR